jgi:hypothetical protein
VCKKIVWDSNWVLLENRFENYDFLMIFFIVSFILNLTFMKINLTFDVL